jgi:hypothetical protein
MSTARFPGVTAFELNNKGGTDNPNRVAERYGRLSVLASLNRPVAKAKFHRSDDGKIGVSADVGREEGKRPCFVLSFH